jgi:hypothetical protein
MPLLHHLYSTSDETFQSQWTEQQHCYSLLSPFLHGSTKDRIIVNDRGGDDEKQFLYCLEALHCSFLTRVNTGVKSRLLSVMRDGEKEEEVSVQSIAKNTAKHACSEKEWKNKKIKKTCTSRIAFTEVRLPHHPEIPLFLIFLYTEGFPEPIALLTDVLIGSTEKAWEVFFWYKKRWEVENFFRAIKQQLRTETFLIRSFQAIRSLLMVQMLVMSVLQSIAQEMKDILGVLSSTFVEYCRRWQRKKESYLDILHWFRSVIRPSTDTGNSYRFLSLRMRNLLKKKPEKQRVDFSAREKVVKG